MAQETLFKKSKKHAVIVGILFIIATAFLFVGGSFYDPILETPDFLQIAYPQRQQAVLGMLLEFACVIAIPLIPAFMFPYLSKFNVPLAVGYVSFRLFEALLFAAQEINTLTQISVSRLYLESGGGDASFYQALGETLRGWNSWEFSIYLFVFTLGGMMFYSVLYQSRLVPRWVSGWGFLAAVLLFIGTILNIFEVNIGTPGMFELIFAMPIAVNEMVLAVWLIVKGFNQDALSSEN